MCRHTGGDWWAISITSISGSPQWHFVAESTIRIDNRQSAQIGIYFEKPRSILPPSLRQSLTRSTVQCSFQSSGGLTYKLYLWHPCQSKFYSKEPTPLSLTSGRRDSDCYDFSAKYYSNVCSLTTLSNTNTLVRSGIYDWHCKLQMFCNPGSRYI